MNLVAPGRANGTDRKLKGRGVTVAIATRNRQDRLLECISSFYTCHDLIEEVLVFDDASTLPPIDEPRLITECSRVKLNCRLIRSDEQKGYIAGRNLLAKEARTEYLLVVDDDVIVLNRKGLERAIHVLDCDESVSAIAFPQVNRDGELEPGAVQPSYATYPCYVDRYYGYGHLLRRTHFLAMGGYREMLGYYGEEPDLSLRLYCSGHAIVFLPERSFAHVPDQGGRDHAKIFRFSARNSCWCAILNMPAPLAFLAICRYLTWHKNTLRALQIRDDEGRKWVRHQLLTRLPELWRQRQPGSYRAVLSWKSIRKHSPEYRLLTEGAS